MRVWLRWFFNGGFCEYFFRICAEIQDLKVNRIEFFVRMIVLIYLTSILSLYLILSNLEI